MPANTRLRRASRLSRLIALSTVLLAAGLISASAAQAQFSGKTKILDLDATCIAKGKAKGRVILDLTVRYADAAEQAESLYEDRGHTVAITSKARLKGKRTLRLRDTGEAQVAIPEISSYRHVHRHELTKAQSRKLTGGRRCGKGRSPVVHLKVRAKQTLGAKPGAPMRQQVRGTSAPAATQSTQRTLSAAVSAGDPGQVIAGCLIADDSNCHGAHMSGADLSGVVAPYSDFSFADLSNANLSNARLGHAIMNKTNLQFANMSGLKIGSGSLTSAMILSADVTGAQMPFANLANASFQGSDISGAYLGGAGLFGTIFLDAKCDENTAFPAIFGHKCENGSVVSPS